MSWPLCGAPHHRHPDTLCTEPAGHYRREADPHAGPLILDGRVCGSAAWDEPKEQHVTHRIPLDHLTSDALDALYDELAEARGQLRLVDGMRQQNLDSAAAAIQRAARAKAAIARVRALADRIRQGAPWTANNDNLADHILAALEESGPAAAEAANPRHCPCDGAHFPSLTNCRWCRCHRVAESTWTPPPPGDTREQLPDHILNLIRPYLRGYTSTACQTAGYLAEAIADRAEHRAELMVWRARMKSRCRDNQKYTGEICPNHTVPGRS